MVMVVVGVAAVIILFSWEAAGSTGGKGVVGMVVVVQAIMTALANS